MQSLSLFSKQDREAWGVLVNLANGQDEAVEAYRKLLRSKGYCFRVPQQEEALPDRPVGGDEAKRIFAKQMRDDLPNMRLLLRWLADPVGSVKDKETVVQILNDRQLHYRRAYGANPTGRPADQTPLQVEAVFEFSAPIDPIIQLVAEQFDHKEGVATLKNLRPIRTCRFCKKLFVRRRKAQFCGEECKITFYNRGPRRADATYQFQRRMLKLRDALPPKRFRETVRFKLAQLEQKPDDKGARVAFLKGLL